MTLRLREPDMFIIMKTVQEIAAFLALEAQGSRPVRHGEAKVGVRGRKCESAEGTGLLTFFAPDGRESVRGQPYSGVRPATFCPSILSSGRDDLGEDQSDGVSPYRLCVTSILLLRASRPEAAATQRAGGA